MNRTFGWARGLCLAVMAGAVGWGCNDLGGGGGGPGGGINFTRGYVFVRPDDQNVYLADASDLTRVAALTQGGGNQQPALSPNGKQVVFVHRGGGDNELDVVSTSGGTASTLLPADGTHPNARTPVFSQDGASIYFVYDAQDGARLAAVGTGGQGARDLTSGALSYASPSVLPDGSILAAAGNSSAQLTQLERVDPTSGSATSITNTLGDTVETISNRLVASPDGTLAAFDALPTSGGPSRIFVVDLNGLNVTQLTDHPGEPNATDSYPTWVDSGTVAFASDVGGAVQVYTAPATASSVAGQLSLPSASMPWFGP